MKKILEDDESSVEVSVHQQPLVTKSCYHQDRDLNKRQNTAAKLRPKVESRILQLTAEVRSNLIGRGLSRLCFDWLDHDVATPALLCHKDTAQGTQSIAFHCVFIA